jgi:hypothetical protein
LQIEPLGGAGGPAIAAVGLAALHAAANGLELGAGQRPIDAQDPIARSGHWPAGQPFTQRRARVLPLPEARPAPLFGPFHEVGPHGVAFDVASDGKKVFVGLDRKRFESSLVDRAGAGGISMGVPTLRVGHGEPTHGFRQLAVGPRPEQQVPVIGHDAVAQQTRPGALDGLLQDALERLVVGRAIEERHPPHASIEHVIHDSARCLPQTNAPPAGQ